VVVAGEVTWFIRDSEGDFLFHHSVRVYCRGALTATAGMLVRSNAHTLRRYAGR
jgi:hypothetical protein